MSGFLPRIWLGDIILKPSQEVRYLGVLLGERCSFRNHLKEIKSKMILRYSCLRSIAGTTRGLKYGCRETLYKAAFLPLALYAAPAWGQKMKKCDLKLLEQAQRRALLLMTGAYRTALTSALQVVTGQLPIDLKIQVSLAKYKIKKGLPATVGDSTFVCPNGRYEDVAERVENMVYTEWQRRWDAGENGRLTYQFIPSVRFKMENKWFEPDFWTMQLLTGHGDINSKLHFFRRRETPNCSCGAVEDVSHILFHCPHYTNLRFELAGEFSRLEWPPQSLHELVLTPVMFSAFKKYAKNVFRLKSSDRG